MAYTFQFGVVADNLPLLLEGAVRTLEFSAAGIGAGLAIGVCGAAARVAGPAPLRHAMHLYVELFRNTPFLVQLFLLYFLLPQLGWRVDANLTAVAGMALNAGAYLTEIVRGGIAAVPEGQIEAGRALGLTRLLVFRKVVLGPALRAAYPAIGSQAVLLMLGSSVVSTISAEELTAFTNTLQSTTFRSFEFYFAATGLYLAMAVLLRLLLDAARPLLFGAPGR